MAADELEFIQWLKERERAYPTVSLGIGDDMAVVVSNSGRLLFSCDMLLDGVHFDTQKHTLSQIGRKAVACNLSDCAAMAVRPAAVTVSVALPTDCTIADARELLEGALSVSKEYDVPLVGGDTTRWSSPLAIDVAILAFPFEGIEPVTRSGALVGDTLYVTGPLGGSLRGRHLSFTPRVAEAKALAEDLGNRLHAMIDISDGLSLDLWRLCEASGIGAILDSLALERIISEDARRAAEADGKSALDHLLSDGEDYELLMAVANEVVDPPVPLHKIGATTASGLQIRHADGRTEVLEPRGYVH